MNRRLPPCEGPKLNRFHRSKSPIEFIRLLRGSLHSHVFEVVIDGNTYALKMFKFYTVQQLWPLVGPERDHVFDPKEVEYHMDPFYAECRAFGHLKDQGRNGIIAVRCDGYTFVEAEHDEFLRKEFGVNSWNRGKEHTNRPFRAIVKQLVSDETPFTAKMIPRMKRNLKELHRLGIYVMDIRPENYRRGLLLDSSTAWTRPHMMLSTKARYPSEIKKNMDEDELYFDKMIDEANEESGVKIWDRMRRSNRYVGKLRPLPHRQRRSTLMIWSGSSDTSSESESTTSSSPLVSSRGRTNGTSRARKEKASGQVPKKPPSTVKKKPPQRGRRRKR